MMMLQSGVAVAASNGPAMLKALQAGRLDIP
jgi:hypothetical protein